MSREEVSPSGKLRGERLGVEIRAGRLRTDGEPPAPSATVVSEEFETPASLREVLDDVVQFRGFPTSVRRDDDVRVHVGVHDVTVHAATNRTLDAHQAVFLDGDEGRVFGRG